MTEVIFKNQNKQKKRTQRIAGYVKQVVHVNEAVTSSEIMRRLVESEDIIFNAPKTNKTLPLLTRHIPYYIGILPTNRQTYLPFNEKSIIT